jgi:iron complex outermembrane receptor protein
MKTPKVKPLALAIIALSQASPLLAQEDTVEEEVYVSGVRAAELNAREAERIKDSFSSIISQDDAGNFADQNVAESLQRLPGLTLLKNEGEGRFVTLRGLGPSFVGVNINGNELATAGEDTRAFALDAIPSDMLGSIEVLKTLTPDQDLNSLAGTVNVKTISAFDRKRDTMKLKLQNNRQNYSGESSPKVALSGTTKFGGETFGLGYALSWEERNSIVYINEHHRDNPPRYIDVDDELILIPRRYESKQENAERERIAGSLTLEYRPVEEHHFKLNLSRTEFEDIDIAMREYHRWGQSSSSLSNPDDDEFVFYDETNNVYGMYGTDIQHQYFIQEGKSITNAFSFNGLSTVGDSWEIDYTLALSNSEWNKPGGRRTQFRIRELPMLGTHGSNYFSSQIISPEAMSALAGGEEVPSGAYYSEYTPGASRQRGMVYDNLFIEDSFREDDIAQLKVDVKKMLSSDSINYFKFGLAAKERERTRDKDRWSVVPSDYSAIGCPESIDPELCSDWTSGSGVVLGEFATFQPSHPDIQYHFETQEAAERIIAVTAPIAYNSDQFNTDISSTQDDYSLSESSQSVYAMAEFIPFENATLIAGAKYETTTFESDGNFSLRNDREDDREQGISGDIVVPLGTAENSYGDLLPSIHLRWEPTEELLFRAALWSSFTRPGFNQARNFASIASRVRYCIVNPPDGYEGTTCGERRDFGELADEGDELMNDFIVSPALGINVGNPDLKAMTSTNFDTSLSWYANDGLFFQAAFFYKDIENFIADVRGANMTLEDLPVNLPLELMRERLPFAPDQEYSDINFATNGEYAKVYGVELSTAINFANGLFISANATLQESKAKLDDSFRGEEIALPFQADQVANLTFGWESDDISVRFSNNYRSKVLEKIGVCPAGETSVFSCQTWNDVYHDNTYSLDFKASWNATSRLNFYFDATNLTDDFSVKYLQGNSDSKGKILYQSEDFGRAVQLGLNFKFM